VQTAYSEKEGSALKRIASLLCILALIMLGFSAMTSAEVPAYFRATGAVVYADHPEWGNFVRVNFDGRVLPEGRTGLLVNVQALTEGSDYVEAVVNGVLDGILVDGKSIRQWNTDAGSAYAAMVHFDGDENDIRIYMDSGLVAFLDGNPHVVELNSQFISYTGSKVRPAKFVYDPGTTLWSEPAVHVTSAISYPDHPEWGNFFRVNFDARVLPEGRTGLLVNVQALAEGSSDFNAAVVDGVLDGILVDGKTIRQWNTDAGGMYGAMVHFDGDENDIRIYMDAGLVAFLDGNPHTVEINSLFKTYLLAAAEPASYTFNPATGLWVNNAIPPVNVTDAQCFPDHPEWGNFAVVRFDAPVGVEGSTGLLTNVQALAEADPNYDAEVVHGVLHDIKVDGKTISEWNTQAGSAYGAMVHFNNDEADIRIYMDAALVAFLDGGTHSIEISGEFKTFRGAYANPILLNYDPTLNVWTQEVVVPPTPTPAPPATFFSSSALARNSTEEFGNVYFYLDNLITAFQRINIQAGGSGVSQELQDAVNDLIKVDGKTVREWNTENESQYAVMVAYEAAGGGDEIFGSLSIWVDLSTTCQFVPEQPHVVDFMPGLFGLNGAVINPARFTWDPVEIEWVQSEYTEEEPTEVPTEAPTGEPTTAPTNGESPSTGDPAALLSLGAAAAAVATLLASRRRR